MCMFSVPVEHVSNTRIFARMLDGAPRRQVLIYAMQLRTQTDVAMVLPVPTPAGASEDALRFVSLEDRAGFFDELDALFPSVERDRFSTDLVESQVSRAPQTLEVHRVGAFEASFVPSRADFVRLDARFRLPDEVLAGLPYDHSWGYAVFKLRHASKLESAPFSARRGLLDRMIGRLRGRPTPLYLERALEQDIHPMAFVFETRAPHQLFFPTIHVHRGTLPQHARFDHQLYFQVPQAPGDDELLQRFMLPPFELIRPDPAGSPFGEGVDPRIQVLHESRGPVGDRVAIPELVDPRARAHRYTLDGTGPNRDLEIMLGTPPG